MQSNESVWLDSMGHLRSMTGTVTFFHVAEYLRRTKKKPELARQVGRRPGRGGYT